MSGQRKLEGGENSWALAFRPSFLHSVALSQHPPPVASGLAVGPSPSPHWPWDVESRWVTLLPAFYPSGGLAVGKLPFFPSRSLCFLILGFLQPSFTEPGTRPVLDRYCSEQASPRGGVAALQKFQICHFKLCDVLQRKGLLTHEQVSNPFLVERPKN